MRQIFHPGMVRALILIATAAIAGVAMGFSIVAVTVLALIGIVASALASAGPSRIELAEPPPTSPEPATLDTPISDVVEAIAEPVLVVADQRVLHANHAARALLGRHILGEDVRLAIRHPAAAERLLERIPSADAAPIHLVGLGVRDQRWEMRVRAVGPRSRIVHLTDRTGSYAAERMRVDFVANASHELRTPLASILGFIETLRDEAGEDAEVRERFLKIMQDEAHRMQRLVDDLTSLSRIEAEKYREPAEHVDLGEMAIRVQSELSAAQTPRSRDLSTRSDPVPPVRGDPAQLSQLLHNLVGNAMKYGRDGTPVEVRIGPGGGGMARLRVSDRGEGIEPDHLPRLTERFYRVDSSRSRAVGGTGLGLAIVKHIVERHRGRLDIQSTPGVGTTVTILLPLAPVSSSRNEAATQAS